MSPTAIALLVTTAPLAAFVLALVVLPRQRRLAAATVVGAGAISCGGALWLLRDGPAAAPQLLRWFDAERGPIAFGLLLDGPNLLFGAVVALVALAVSVYSLGYMAGDRGWSRYFALLGLFSWSMLSFVFSANLLQMFIFWELVGLASFLLIGFWYEKPAAAAAARKAFIMTRIGDVGLMIGMIMLFNATGTLDVRELSDPQLLGQLPQSRLALIALLFFAGVVGKSAQFPLHTWLPDAMEGPTPVSALLHSATMVAAGVYLFARFHPLFMAVDYVARIVLGVALGTALLAATMALVERDIKRVLAFSSISQLGFMLMGLAVGSLHAGLFHLVTHAFFKALLFLCAGSYIHHCGSNDLVAIGRAGGRKQRWTTLGLVIGAGALAGVPPLAGFFSKEAVLGALALHQPPAIVALAYLASFLTAYYSFRMVFLVLRPQDASAAATAPDERHAGAPGAAHVAHDEHASPGWAGAVMRVPIVVLTVLAAGAGWGGAYIGRLAGVAPERPHALEMLLAIALALAGIGLAWIEFGRRGAAQRGFVARVPALHALFSHRWYLDALYAALVARLLSGISRLCALVESRGLDGAVDGMARGTVAGGRGASAIQGGRLQVYIGASALLLAVACYLIGAL
ncbi:MAG: NADH-quinone oxidoreductase subunit L [Proteobacteria bacterium]|nr:NADH-quinone oxidoreductase subunit L [Pseudomonadota bacterium]